MPNVHHRCVTTLDVGRRPSSAGGAWQSFKMLFHGFADLPSAVGQYILSPEFTCNGHQWCIELYPGGTGEAGAGNLSLYLQLCSGGYATTTFRMSVLDKYQSVKYTKKSTLNFYRLDDMSSWGYKDYCARSYILDQSNTILDDNGTLAVIVSLKKDSDAPFVPSNPIRRMMAGMFLDEETADVCFEVGSADVHDLDDGDEVAPLHVSFHAHSFVLKTCAPMLASLFGSDGDEVATASISDVRPAIFRHMLHYVYGGDVAEGELRAHSKDIINAADKYSIVNLKLEAEAAFVKETKITMDNAIDNLLYADAQNLALLKEVVIDFLAENSAASQNLDFTDVPVYLMKDVFAAFGRKMKSDAKGGNDDDLSVMSVSELRRKLDEIGLNADGSREAMIEALTANANGSADAEEDDENHDDESDDDSDDSMEE